MLRFLTQSFHYVCVFNILCTLTLVQYLKATRRKNTKLNACDVTNS